MGQVTHEQVNLMLRLYELRREPRLREARRWFADQLQVTTPEELQKQCPPGSENSANLRMTLSYWDMCASIVNRGLVDEELFFENTGEQFVVWEKIKPVVPAFRTMFKNPLFLSNLEEHCRHLEAWREKRAPGSTAAFRQYLQQMAKAAAAASGQATKAARE